MVRRISVPDCSFVKPFAAPTFFAVSFFQLCECTEPHAGLSAWRLRFDSYRSTSLVRNFPVSIFVKLHAQVLVRCGHSAVTTNLNIVTVSRVLCLLFEM